MKGFNTLTTDSFNNLSFDEWSRILNYFNATINYTSWFLKYIELLNAESKIKNYTFVLFQKDTPIAIVPLYVEFIEDNWQISMGQEPVFAPVFNKNIEKLELNKYYDFLLSEVDNLAKFFKCKLARFQYSPLLNNKPNYNYYENFGYIEDITYPDWYIFKAKYSYIIDLIGSIDELYKGVRKSNKPHINKTRRETKCLILDKSNFSQSLFDSYVDLYYSVKGHRRSLSAFSFDAIAIQEGFEVLIMCEYKNKLVGAVALHTYNKKARYNSSIQDPKIDKLIFPNHFLLWQSILYLHKKEFKLFEIGEQVIANNFVKVSEKEKNLSHFKAGWGGVLVPWLKIQKNYEYV